MKYLLLLSLFATAALPFANAAELADVLSGIDQRAAQRSQLARSLWEQAELGYLEKESSALLQSVLAEAGFDIESGVAGIPTAFVATFGKRGPVIGILAEFDALPGINQDALAERSLIDGKNAGHACGHNLFGAASVDAALAVKRWLEETGTAATIKLYGTPAEEGGSGKVYMVRAGLFEDVDVALHWHPDDKNSAAATTTLANRSAKFRFYGKSAHAAGAPEKARSALDGVEAFNHMINLMREHIPQDSRIHYVITHGGLAPNVVPDFAEVFYYVRNPAAELVTEIWQRVEQAALGAAQGTGTRVEWEIIHGNHPLVVVESLAKMVDAKLQQVGGIEYDKEEQVFANKIHATLDNPKYELGSQSIVQPYTVELGYGSTDVGDVSIAVPTVGFNTATWVPGTSAHTWQAVAASGMSIGFKGTTVATKVLTLAAIELIQNKALRDQAKAEHAEMLGEDFHYQALLGDRQPPLDFRK